MAEVAREVQTIKQAHQEEMEAQRYSFQMEIEKVRKELHQVESRSELRTTTLENEINTLKSQDQAPKQRPTRDTSATRNTPTISTSIESPKGKETATPTQKSYAQIAASKVPKISTEKTWTEVTGGSRRRKTPSMPRIEPEKRRVIFWREALSAQKSEADLMLALNESLQKASVPPHTRFSRVGYLQSGAISALLTEKSSADQLITTHANILIRAAKSVGARIIRVEALERWQRLKVYGMPLERYLGEGKMVLLRRELESSTGIQLKTISRWLISESRLEERLESGTGRGSAIVITVGTSEEAAKVCSKGLRFGGALKVVEKYWEAGPGSVCMSCAGIGHDRLEECKDRAIQCIICVGVHKAENHRCGVTGCIVKGGEICTHVTPKYANCGGNHQATAYKCPARLKAQTEAWKKKKSQAKDKQPACCPAPEEESQPTSTEMDLDTAVTLWAKSLGPESSELSSFNDDIPENSQSRW